MAGLDVLEAGGSMADAQAAAVARAESAVEMTLADFSVTGDYSMKMDCDKETCFAPGSLVTAEVSVSTRLPGVPALVAGALPINVNLSAVGRSPVDG